MKKILFGLTLMAAMASCTEDYKDWASPANNPQEPVKSVEVEVTSALQTAAGRMIFAKPKN